MKCLPGREAGISAVEVVVGLSVACVLAAMGLFWLEANRPKPSMMQQLRNFRQLHLATQTMTLDGTTTGDTNLVWPGDSDGRFATWVKMLVPAYLSTNDFRKLVTWQDMKVSSRGIPLMKETAVRVYGVKESSPANAVFLTSANFTNTAKGGGGPLDPKAQPFGDRGFVVFRRGGDGAILMKSQAGNTNVIGAYEPMMGE